MKIARLIFLVLGVILILIEGLALTSKSSTFHIEASSTLAEKIGYFIGYTFPAIVGLIFLLIASLINRKIKKRQEMIRLNLLARIDKLGIVGKEYRQRRNKIMRL